MTSMSTLMPVKCFNAATVSWRGMQDPAADCRAFDEALCTFLK